jgi:hypothetical protein
MSSALSMVIAAVFIVTFYLDFNHQAFGSFEKKALRLKKGEEYIKEYLALKAEEERKSRRGKKEG